MKTEFGGKSRFFRPWKSEHGRVFDSPFAFDCETTLIDEERPWIAPAYVLGAAFDGTEGYLIPSHRASEFFAAHEATPFILHNAVFDLAVMHVLAPGLDIYRRVDTNSVWDTQLLHRLYVLGAQGHSASHMGESTLERCVAEYLGLDLPKDIRDSQGNFVRLSYGRWLNRPLQEIEQIYLEYLAKDVIATFWLYQELQQLLHNLLNNSQKVWGYVSGDWLTEQIQRWGPQTHHIQLRAAIVLGEITANGLHLDTQRREELVKVLKAVLEETRDALRMHAYLPGQKGSGNALQGILKRLEQKHPELDILRTATERYATSQEALQDLSEALPFAKLLLTYRATEKLLNSFLDKMNRRVLHPSFNVLARTGRTTSFGQINAQNLPKDERIRSCFVPSPNHVFIDADYRQIELAALAQACAAQFGLNSKMGDAINAGRDLHKVVAARVIGRPEEEVSHEDRKKAKPINFGKPGGMGNATMKSYAKASYGVELTDQEVQNLSDAWFALFPEMHEFLNDSTDTPLELARLFGLTPFSHFEITGDSRFLHHPENLGREHKPHSILGMMCLKMLKTPNPQRANGRPYLLHDIDYFWNQIQGRVELLPAKMRPSALNRQPSLRLQRAVMGLAGRAGVFTSTGRLRANASYCARHNTVFQGLAADGAKLALWLLWRGGYRIANFIHDQVLIEVRAESDLKAHAERIRGLMIEGMKAVVLDINVDVSYAASDRWSKDAEAVFDGNELLLWQPPQKGDELGIASPAENPGSQLVADSPTIVLKDSAKG